MSPNLMTYAEVAAEFGVSRRTVNRLVSRRVLAVVRLGHCTVRFRRNDLEKAIEKLTEKAR